MRVTSWLIWGSFLGFLGLLLFLDLGLLHRGRPEVSTREAVVWTAVWVGVAAAFGLLVLAWKGPGSAGEFTAGYLIEWSLSVDNVLIFAVLVERLAVPPELRHRLLFLGVVGAIVFRLGFILAGAALLHRFEWIAYVFGALLLVTAARLLLHRDRTGPAAESRFLRAARRRARIHPGFEGGRLFVRADGRVLPTQLLVALVLIEMTDLLFAVDSVPAVFSVTDDAFVAFTSNALAILGLRSLFFLVAGASARFTYLAPALVVVLAFVGIKMLLSGVLEVPTWTSLGVIGLALGTGIGASLVAARRATNRRPGERAAAQK
jgi:tellurite resistance protein TerC